MIRIQAVALCVCVCGMLGCSKQSITRAEASGLLIPIDPHQAAKYPKNGYFTVARSPRASSPLDGTPTIYDDEQDLFYHAIYIDPEAFARLSLATGGYAPRDVTKLIEPNRPFALAHIDQISNETKKIQGLFSAHPDLGRPEIRVVAEEGQEKVYTSRVAGLRGADFIDVTKEVDRSARQLEIMFNGPLPAKLAYDLRTQRNTEDADKARGYILQGSKALLKLMDADWVAVIQSADADGERSIGRSWLALQELWLSLGELYANKAEPGYEELKLPLRQFGAALNALNRSTVHELFIAGQLFPQVDQEKLSLVARNTLTCMRSLAESAVALLSVYRPRKYVNTGEVSTGIYDGNIIK